MKTAYGFSSLSCLCRAWNLIELNPLSMKKNCIQYSFLLKTPQTKTKTNKEF